MLRFSHVLLVFVIAFAYSAFANSADPNNSGYWYVRLPNTQPSNQTSGPFSSIGLEPVANLNKATADKPIVMIPVQPAVAAPQTAPVPNKPLVKPTIVEPEPENPLAETKEDGIVRELKPEDKAKLKPAVVLGVPDKDTQPELYKEWRKNQETFGYLGLHRVKPKKIDNLKAKGKIFNPVKVIGQPYNAGNVPELTPREKRRLTVYPDLEVGVVEPPITPLPTPQNMPLIPEAVVPSVLTYKESESLPVPGAKAAPIYPVQTSFVEVDEEEDLQADIEDSHEAHVELSDNDDVSTEDDMNTSDDVEDVEQEQEDIYNESEISESSHLEAEAQSETEVEQQVNDNVQDEVDQEIEENVAEEVQDNKYITPHIYSTIHEPAPPVFYRNPRSFAKDKALYKLAQNVNRFLNKLGAASVVEKRIADRALFYDQLKFSNEHEAEIEDFIKSLEPHKEDNTEVKQEKAEDKKDEREVVNNVKETQEALEKAEKAENLENIQKSASSSSNVAIKKAFEARKAAKIAVANVSRLARKALKALKRAKANPGNKRLAQRAKALISKERAEKKSAQVAILAAKNAASAATKLSNSEKELEQAKAVGNTAQVKKAEVEAEQTKKEALKKIEKTAEAIKNAKKAATEEKKSIDTKTAGKPVDPTETSQVTALKSQVSALKAQLAQLQAKKSIESANKVDESKADAPKAETPKAETPKAEAPKVDAPKADAPKSISTEDDKKNACNNASSVLSECMIKKDTSEKCTKAKKAVESKTCVDIFAKTNHEVAEKAKASLKTDDSKELACNNASSVLAECMIKKENSDKCTKAKKAVESKTCTDTFAKKNHEVAVKAEASKEVKKVSFVQSEASELDDEDLHALEAAANAEAELNETSADELESDIEKLADAALKED